MRDLINHFGARIKTLEEKIEMLELHMEGSAQGGSMTCGECGELATRFYMYEGLAFYYCEDCVEQLVELGWSDEDFWPIEAD